MAHETRKEGLPASAAFVERLASEITVQVRAQHAPPGTLAAVAVRLAEEGQTLQRTNSRLMRDLLRPGHVPLTSEQQSGIEALLLARAANLRAQAEMLQDLIDQATEHENAIVWLQSEVKKRDELLRSRGTGAISGAEGLASPVESRKRSLLSALLGTLASRRTRN